jgi:hypothetical protein
VTPKCTTEYWSDRRKCKSFFRVSDDVMLFVRLFLKIGNEADSYAHAHTGNVDMRVRNKQQSTRAIMFTSLGVKIG